MSAFEFFSTPRVLFGRGQFKRLGEVAPDLGSVALLIYNGDEPGRGSALDRALAMLATAGVRATPLRQKGEPKVQDVDQGVEAARRAGSDFVIGLGGGSAIDAAKAVAGLLANGGSALDYMEVVGRGQKITKPAAPWVAVPTTAGTGAEVTRNAVIGYPEKQFKASLRSEHLLPRVAIVDPELGVNVPPDVTAQSGMDALCQCIEAYTSTGAQPVTDVLALRGVAKAARSLRAAYADGSDIEAREDMALAALLSGICLTNAGLGAVHGFAAPLGANFPAPHGAVCAALLPHVIRANVEALRASSPDHPTLVRYAAVGQWLTGRFDLPNDEAADAAVRVTSDLARDLNIPPLERWGVGMGDVTDLVALARKASSMRYNPVALSDAALSDILYRAGVQFQQDA